MTDTPKNCQKCGSPVTPGMKFCESCGAKIEIPPSCPKCGAVLTPNVKFCESCGAPVSPEIPAPTGQSVPPEIEDLPPKPVAKPEEPMKPETKPAPASDKPASTATTVKTEEKTIKKPEEKPVPATPPAKEEVKTAPAPVKETVKKETVKTEKTKDSAPDTGTKQPVSRNTMIIAGVIILALLGAVVFFVVLPMLSGSGTPVQAPTTPSGTPYSGSTGTGSSSSSGTVSLVPGPTDVPPANRALIIDVEKNAISREIIVTFQGGEGQYGVRELLITVTRSDGTAETKTMTRLERGNSITVKGTDKSDRVEITANFYNGETYKIVDKVFEYKKRVGSY